MTQSLQYTVLMTMLLSLTAIKPATAQDKPNIIVILTDDMGFGDISYFGGRYATPNIDKLAASGRVFTNYYSASPICSPSRVGILTGMTPARWSITSYLQTKKGNRNCEQADYLSASAPSVARILKAAGYATGHFGKWHMGGGRDVDDAPSIHDYGFDEYNSTWESPDPDPLITASDWIWSPRDSIKRWDRTAYFVDRALAFLQAHREQPCFVDLWPDDVHTPWVAGDAFVGRYPGGPEEEKSFIRVLEEYDRQIGRLIKGLQDLGIADNTLVIFTSDNGPLPNFRDDRSLGMRGSKLSLYEGGTRMPFIACWPGHIPAGTKDSSSVISANDLLPTFSQLAQAALPGGYQSDGENRLPALLGAPSARNMPLFWEYGRNDSAFRYPAGLDHSPSLAVREGPWKLLMNSNGTGIELYNIDKDRRERNNLAAFNTAIVTMLRKKLEAWWQALPRVTSE